MAGPANTPAKPDGLRGFAGIDKPAKVSSADAEQVGESLNVEHGGRRYRPVAAGVSAGGGNVGTHVEFSK
jgi:hypothetical protein